MIRKYNSFLILEKLKTNLELLLEDNLTATSAFLDKLKFLSKEKGMVGKIAEAIFDFIERSPFFPEGVIKQNFFDVTDKEDFVSFLMQSKVPEDWDDERDPSLPFNMKGRGEIKVAKIIRYIIELMRNEDDWQDETPKDKDIEAFVNAYKATKSSSSFKFKLVKADDISKYYNQKRYMSASGSLGGSCMSEESRSTFKIYTENETKVKLLVLIDEDTDKISGRALVWKLKDSPCEAKYFMDRVYTNRDSDFYKFKQFAEENGYLYKTRMNSHIDDNVSFMYKGKEILGVVTVKLDGSFTRYPFIDTLCFLSSDQKLLSNIPSKDCYVLHSVFGDKDICDDCNGKVLDCDTCSMSDGEVECEDCDASGDTDSGKCRTCKGEGYLDCKHKDADYCRNCAQGLKILVEKGITKGID